MLHSVDIGGLALEPAFDPATMAYTARARHSLEQITVSAVIDQGDAAAWAPADAGTAAGHQVNLMAGAETDITLTFTPDGGAAVDYEFAVHRNADAMAELVAGFNGLAGVAITADASDLTTPANGLNGRGWMADARSGSEAEALYGSEYWRLFQFEFRADVTTQGDQDRVRDFLQDGIGSALDGLDNRPALAAGSVETEGGDGFMTVRFRLVSTVPW